MRRIISVCIILILVLALGGVSYYSFAIHKDINGLSAKDIRQAEKALLSYVDAVNEREYEKALSCLSAFYAENLGANQQMLESGSGILLVLLLLWQDRKARSLVPVLVRIQNMKITVTG